MTMRMRMPREEKARKDKAKTRQDRNKDKDNYKHQTILRQIHRKMKSLERALQLHA